MRIVIAAALMSVPVLRAQTVGSWEIGGQFMHSTAPSRANTFFGGQAAGVGHSAFALTATTDLLRLGGVRLRYSAQLLPAIHLSNVERYAVIGDVTRRTYVLQGRTDSYGYGLVPLGLDLSADLGPRVRLQVGAGAGIMRFSQHVPTAAGRQRNFTAEADAALMLRAGGGRWVQVGIRFKHISNGLTAYENQGIDNRLLFAGISWWVRVPR